MTRPAAGRVALALVCLFLLIAAGGAQTQSEQKPTQGASGAAGGEARVDGPVRVFDGPELDKLDVESRGFLLFLEQHRVLDAHQRELVLDRAMALDQDELDLDDLKWVVLMVLFTQPGAEAAYAWMETQMFGEEPEPVH